jgi:hypothetical protein
LPNTPLEKGWLAALVADEIRRHDPDAPVARLPADEVRAAAGPEVDLAPAARLLAARSLRIHRADAPPADTNASFLEEVRGHVGLLLDLDVLCGTRHAPARRRAEIAAFLAAGLGEPQVALDVLPVAALPPEERDVERALWSAELAFDARFHPPGDPLLGLPLHPGAVASLRRRLARVAMSFHREGRLELSVLGRHAVFADAELLLLAEALAGLLAAAEPPDERARAVRQRQVERLGLARPAARLARAAVAAPRGPAVLATAAPERHRPFLVEQLFLAQLRAKLPEEGAARFVEAFVAASALDPPAIAAARIEAAAQHGDHQVWFDAIEPGAATAGWPALAVDWEAATDAMVERVSAAVTQNLGAVVREIRETGELGQLLARAASGNTLTAEERRKVRAQLVDLAKAVPALAIFAAPGGMLLLPLLAKLLPFNLLPSAWDRPPAAPKGEAPAATRPKPTKAPKVEPAE